MPLIPWRPFWDLWPEEDWPDWESPRWGRMLPAIRSPRMDVYEDNGNIVAEAELPGIDPKNIEVEVKDNVLRVEAKTEEKKEEKKGGTKEGREEGRKGREARTPCLTSWRRRRRRGEGGG